VSRENPWGLGPGREFDLIGRLLDTGEAPPPGVLVGPGDDCLVLDDGVAISVDLTVEGIHFRRDWFSLEDAGYRGTAGALSDLAAMGAEPLGVLLSMGLAPEEAGVLSRWHRTLPYAYPVPTPGRDEALAGIVPALEERGVYPRGRFGAWRYEVGNMDHCWMQGAEVADRILEGRPETVLKPLDERD